MLIGRAVATDRLQQSMFEKPLKKIKPIARGIVGISDAVQDVIEHIIMIAADKFRIFKREEEIDHAARIGAAIYIIADEIKHCFFIAARNFFDERLEGPKHSVHIADDPSHVDMLPHSSQDVRA